MAILDEDVARVRAETDFVQLASEHVALKKVGRRWTGLCPFHAEKSPSFTVNAEENLFHCFGCQIGGDVITFLREVEHLDFVEAVERLAGRANIQLRYDDAAASKDRQRRGTLLDAMEKAVEWYHQRLMTAPDGGPARQYLRSRGYDGEVVKEFRLGWAPEDWDALARSLNLPDDILTDTGLGFVNRRSRQQDAFRGRVMFPIFDASGKAVAFGGRTLTGDGPKYKNSQETPIYSKRRTLYGLNWAKTDVVQAGEVIVCEGYTDVIGLFRSGLPRAVATCGTALADEHFRVLKNFARRVVLAYDADAAGQAAAERFYEWEQRYEVDIAVAEMPSGSDPGDLAQRDPELLRTAIKEARPFLAFRLERAMAGTTLRAPVEARARVATKALEMIAEHPSDVVRREYVGQVAGTLGLEVERLLASMPAPGRRATPVQVRRTEVEGPEIEALRLAIHQPELVADRLEDVLFADELHLAAFRALVEAEELHDAIAHADPGAAALLQRLAVDEAVADADDVVARLVEQAVDRALTELKSEAGASDDRFAELSAVTGWVKLAREQLRESEESIEAANRLVAWLRQRAEEVV
jgi:DNA primase